MDNEAKLLYSDLDPHTKAELEAANNYRNKLADSENDSIPQILMITEDGYINKVRSLLRQFTLRHR